ncbi:dephospho-CoA kinase [Thiomicrospira cyclica]|uniref:Dephospho-CoA kinase n=1 Tax=Thiomicrospira cyclica (strain DSM 14477 / JCM 11371 / ALM1) TaxID=717773 RepID=F6D9M7_THICA|nr:dephospho-CoA kinase [Thiomicrospira cyclica]AEG30984.1 Dephospho-CoA kinase [Thiomicrospira cyclica ALM1]
MKSGQVVAVIGGIGCGKSAACDYFSQQGYPVIDTDKVAKQLMQKNQPGYNALVTETGDRFLDPNGDLDRKQLAAAFFAEPDLKNTLEGFIHPLVRQHVAKQVTELKNKHPLVFVAIPVIHQVMQPAYQIDQVLLIECEPEQQTQRVQLRDQRSPEQIATIIAQQADRATRQALADTIIENNQELADLHSALQAWLDKQPDPH